MIHTNYTRTLIALCLSWLTLTAGTTQAAGTSSYYLAIAEDNDVVHLAATANDSPANQDAFMMAQKFAGWKTQQELLAFRDYPYFELTNTSTDPTAAISHFRIAIDPSRPYNFDTVFFIEASPGINYVINGPDTVQNGLRTDFVDITFTGFTADKFFRWRSDIDNDAGDINFYTDYRTVLTDAGGLSPATNALVNVDMSNGTSFSGLIPPGQLMGPFMTGTMLQPDYHAMDMVQPYVMGAEVIPEPTSWMAMGSLAGIGVLVYRRRQAAKLS